MKDKNLEKELNNLRTNEKLNTQFNEDLWSDLSEKYNKFNYLNSVMKDTNKKERLPFFKKRNLLVGLLSIVAFFTIVAVPTYSYLKVPTFQETVNRLLKIVPIGTVEINSTPDGAQAFINGEYQGLTPLTLELPEGNYTLFLNKDDVGMKYETFEVKASEVTTLAVDLTQTDEVVDEYANWSTYSNSRLGSGVAFRYPRNWEIKEIEAPGAFVIAVSNDDFTVKVMHSEFSNNTAVALMDGMINYSREINGIGSAERKLDLLLKPDYDEVAESIKVEFSINDLAGENIAMGLADDSEDWMLIEKIMNSVTYLEEFDFLKEGSTEDPIEEEVDEDTLSSEGDILRSDKSKYIVELFDPISNSYKKVIRDINGAYGNLYDPWKVYEYALTDRTVLYNANDFIMSAGTGATKAPDYLVNKYSDSNVAVKYVAMQLSPDEKNLLFYVSIFDINNQKFLSKYKDLYSGFNVVNLQSKEIYPVHKVIDHEYVFLELNSGWAVDSSAVYITHIQEGKFDVHPVSDNGFTSAEVYAEYTLDFAPTSFEVALESMDRAIIRTFNINGSTFNSSLVRSSLDSKTGKVITMRTYNSDGLNSSGSMELSVDAKYLMINSSEFVYDVEKGSRTRVTYRDTYGNILIPNDIKFVSSDTFVAKYCMPNSCYAVGTYDLKNGKFLESDEYQGLNIIFLH